MLAGWVSSTTSATQNTISNRTSEGVACAAAEIVIDDVYAGAGSGSIARVIVRNSGGSDNLAITSAQLYDRLGHNFTSTSPLPISLNRGQLATINFTFPNFGATTNDSAHGINNGTLTNGPNYIMNGKFESALNLDGINDFVDVGNNSSLHLSVAVTIVVWAKYIGHGFGGEQWQSIFQSGGPDGWTDLYWLHIDSVNGRVGVNLENTTGGRLILYSDSYTASSLLSENTWYYIAFNYDANGGSNNFGIYVNGTLYTNLTRTGNIGSSNASLRIGGGGPFGNGYQFNGTIDDAAIWNRSLTNAEINTSMNVGPASVSNTNDLVGYWKFDEGKGILSCPSDFSRVVVTTNCGGVSAEFSKPPKC